MNIKIFLILLLFIPVSSSHVGAQWSTSNMTDEMTNESSYFAHSERVNSIQRMQFPYQDVAAWLGVGCKENQWWSYIGFSESPNLLDTETEDGFSRIQTRIKWDDEIENVRLTQDWGSNFIHFVGDARAITRIRESNAVLLELNWYGSGKVYFEFLLVGSATALQEIKTKCEQ